jgi:predicted Zn-dependent peptidase
MDTFSRTVEKLLRDPWASRLFLAFTVGMFLSCSAAVASSQPALDRTARPASTAPKPMTLPRIQVRTLSNGLRIAVLEDHEIPAVQVSAVVEIPTQLEPAGKEGVAGFTRTMLTEGTTSRSAEALVDAFAELGSAVSPFGFYTITRNLDASLALMAEQLMSPAFPQGALDRLKANAVTGLRRQKEQPSYIASRVFANVVFGAAHPYTRTTTEASVASITRDDVVAFHQQYYRPQNIALVVVGDVTADAAAARAETAFARWQQVGPKASLEIPAPTGPAATTIYLHDRPGSPQSFVVVGQLGPRRDAPEYFALSLLNTALGGGFNSRLNLNLREQRHFTYGAGSGFTYRPVPQVGMFTASASVQTEKTDSAVVEMLAEIRGILNARPLTPTELAFAKSGITKGLPLAFETVPQIAGGVATILTDKLPLDYYSTVSTRVAAVTVQDAMAAGRRYLDPDRMAIIVIGDRRVIEAKLRASGLAPIVIVDDQGRPIADAR